MKKVVALLALMLVVAFVTPVSIFAYGYGFSGTIGYSLRDVTRVKATGDGDRIANVDWTNSPDGGHFNVWFEEWDKEENDFNGASLFYGYTDGVINLEEKTAFVKKYVLAAHREHIGDPQIRVDGTWNP